MFFAYLGLDGALIDELLHFPTGRTDDQIDVMGLFGRMLAGMNRGHVPEVDRSLDPDQRPTLNELFEANDRGMEERALRI